MSGDGKVWPLSADQRPAVAPQDSVWLSASAGTGKTQVLSARVLRLLLQGDVDPSQILCLTFTKAGAAEMALRIKEVLARWVRLGAVDLAADLEAIGADSGPATQGRARTLFARVLDCPGGGLRIDTIHAFSQWLLAAFPGEAGLAPGVRAMEDRDRDLLAREVLAQMLLDAEARGEAAVLEAVAMLSLRMGAEDVPGWLMRCAAARQAWEGPGAWQEPLRPRVEALLGLPVGADESHLAALCADDVFDVEGLRRCFEIAGRWKAETGKKAAAAMADWLSRGAGERLAGLDSIWKLFFTAAGKPTATGSYDKIDASYSDLAGRVRVSLLAVHAMRANMELADWLTPALSLGLRFFRVWDEAKQREGLIDFDDQIRLAAALLGRGEAAEWIRYKLDRRFDHILVDEAQDTNAAQWSIIHALTGDFFTGLGARDDKLRTLFVVGDYKQAIFRFQGTSPENFEAARQRFRAAMNQAADNAEQLRSNVRVRRLQELGLDRSYRTSQPVLDFVNQALAAIGHESFGLDRPPEPHQGDTRAGYVGFWQPVGVVAEAAAEQEAALEEESGEEGDEGQEGWLSRPDRLLADRLAQQLRDWMERGFPLIKGRAAGQAPYPAGPGDVMILVRKRRELAGLIVARLHAAGVPVAGVDRLRLGAPLAVKDLLAALRFAAQPLDDLNLANLLVSPLIGWSQEQLLEHGWRPRKLRLWDHLRRGSHRDVAQVLEQLGTLLARADFGPPQALLHWLLVGPWQARRRLVARLGGEANDPIDELLNAAHAHSASATPSLAGFLHWFDAGTGDIKREAGGSAGMVRVMTVHGAKGLQAPIVILADAAGNPHPRGGVALDLPEPHDAERSIPLPSLRKEERHGRLAEAAERLAAEEMQEHWRLLYVAMTRAEEALFITGSLSGKERVPHVDSWYARLEALIPPETRLDDPRWGYLLEHGRLPEGRIEPRGPMADGAADVTGDAPLPPWLHQPAAPEPRPARPLAPSALGEDQSADPPWPPGSGAMAAARRGTLIHALLERLPDLAPAQRAAAAALWLERQARDLDGAARAEMAGAALAIVNDPAFADLFGPGSLAEVPIAALVGAQVVAGTIDRLLVTPERVCLIDYKTARRPPDGLEQVPRATLRQMAAYAAALGQAYPGRRIEAALLYTQAPRLIALPADLLAAHKPELAGEQ